MAKIEKFLRRLSFGERRIAKDTLVKLLSGEFHGLDIKKIKGYKNLYRIRKGNLRIVFYQEEDIREIVFIGRRGDSTYEKF